MDKKQRNRKSDECRITVYAGEPISKAVRAFAKANGMSESEWVKAILAHIFDRVGVVPAEDKRDVSELMTLVAQMENKQ